MKEDLLTSSLGNSSISQLNDPVNEMIEGEHVGAETVRSRHVVWKKRKVLRAEERGAE